MGGTRLRAGWFRAMEDMGVARGSDLGARWVARGSELGWAPSFGPINWLGWSGGTDLGRMLAGEPLSCWGL